MRTPGASSLDGAFLGCFVLSLASSESLSPAELESLLCRESCVGCEVLVSSSSELLTSLVAGSSSSSELIAAASG